MNIIKKAVNFLKEAKAELAKVSWSTPQELMSSTIVVIVATAIMAVFIGVIDISLSKILSAVFK
jgi:preprotein translocase subunit SecE